MFFQLHLVKVKHQVQVLLILQELLSLVVQEKHTVHHLVLAQLQEQRQQILTVARQINP